MPVSPSHGFPLLGITLAAVIGLVLLVSRWKVHAFPGLIIASIFVGVASGLRPAEIVTAFQEGMGSTLGFIAVVVGLGTMLGKLLAESGGAEVIARRMIGWMGTRHLHWALMLVGLVVGLPVFFGVGVVLLIPILRDLCRQTGQSRLFLGLPLMAGLSVAHGLVPPHPGPLVAIDKLGADTGRTILWSLVIGLPTAILAGPVFGRWIASRVGGLSPMAFAAPPASRPGITPPGFGLTLVTILLPVLIMLLGTVAQVFWHPGSADGVRDWVLFAAKPAVAMLVAVLFAARAFGTARGFTRAQVLRFCEESVGPAAVIFLVVGAGGGFSKVLIASGVDRQVAQLVSQAHVSPLLLGWLMAAVIRVAVGSATVAITLAAGLAAPIASAVPGTNPELLVVALGAGSLFLSHLNDGGFWFVKEYLELDVPQTLRTWSVLETLISLVALGGAMLLDIWF